MKKKRFSEERMVSILREADAGDKTIVELCHKRGFRQDISQISPGFHAIADQVWIATENGISIYQCGKIPLSGKSRLPSVLRYAAHTWHYITAVNGLPPNPDCIAFDSHGRAFVGTQCNGLAIGTPGMALPVGTLPGQPFAKQGLTWRWRVVTGPQHISQLRTAYGYGLPGNLVNCVLVTPANHVYVGTDWGLAYSTNDGQSYRYERGQDYAAKIMGLWHSPQGYRPPPQEMLKGLLPGDHITCLAQDLAGNIWIGTWRNGYEVLNPETGKEFKSEDSPALAKADGYISQICPITEISAPKPKSEQPGLQSTDRRRERKIPIQLNQTMLVGRYGFGVHEFGRTIETAGHISRVAWRNLHHRPAISNLPQKAKPPTINQLTYVIGYLKKKSRHELRAVYAGADWVTQGDWIGRYGKQYAVLFARDEPLNEYVCFSGFYYHIRQAIGPHHQPGDGLRAWLAWPNTRNPRTLYDPVIGHRCESDIDDHGEAYPYTWQDLGIWIGLHITAKGAQRVALHFFNKDGHALANRRRDYVLELYPQLVEAAALNQTPIATSRVVNYSGGVYQSFIVHGPGNYLLRIRRNGSLNTNLEALFIDRLSGPPIPSDSLGLSFLPHVTYGPPAMPHIPVSTLKTYPALGNVEKLDSVASHRNGQCGDFFIFSHISELWALRLAQHDHAPADLIGHLRWDLNLWNHAERRQFREICKQGWTNLLAENPQLHGKPPH